MHKDCGEHSSADHSGSRMISEGSIAGFVSKPLPIIEIISQHAEEAAFLWAQRDAASAASHFTLRDLARLDARLEAHVDGLRVAGDEGWDLSLLHLELEGPGGIFAPAVLAFGSGDASRIDAVLSMGTQTLPQARVIVSALGWLHRDVAVPFIEAISQRAHPLAQWIAIGTAAAHRVRPRRLREALSHEIAAVRARACRAAGETGAGELYDLLIRLMKDPDEECAFCASSAA